MIRGGGFTRVTEELSPGAFSSVTGAAGLLGRRATKTDTTSTSQVVSITTGMSAGNLAVLVARCGGGTYITGVADSQGNVWAIDKNSTHTAAVGVIASSVLAKGLVAGVDTITVTMSSSTTPSIAVYEIAGPAASPADVNASAQGSGTAAAAGPTTATTQASEIALALIVENGTGGDLRTNSPGGGWMLQETGDNQNIELYSQVLSSEQTVSFTNTVPSAPWAVVLQTYKALVLTNVYSATLLDEPDGVTFNGTPLSEAGSLACDNDEWYWASPSSDSPFSAGTLYVNVGADPSSGTLVVSRTGLHPQRITPFSGGSIADFATVQAAPGEASGKDYSGSAVTEVPDPLGGGGTVLKLDVHNTDVFPITPTSDPRAQLLTDYFIQRDDEMWIKLGFLLKTGDFPSSGVHQNQLFQIHGKPYNGSVPLCLSVEGENYLSLPNGQYLLWRRGGQSAGRDLGEGDIPWMIPTTFDGWIDVLFHIKFATDGWVEMWVNGNPVTFFNPATSINPYSEAETTRVFWCSIVAGNNDQKLNLAYLQNYYKLDDASEMIVYHAPLRVGNTRHSVGG